MSIGMQNLNGRRLNKQPNDDTQQLHVDHAETDDQLGFGGYVRWLLVSFQTAVKYAVNAVGFGENGGVANAETNAKAKTEHFNQIKSINYMM